MRPYSLDLRERVVAAVDHHDGSIRWIARIFRVSTSFIVRLLQQRRDTGTIDPNSSSTLQCSISSTIKDLTHQPGGVALGAGSPPGVTGETCRTVGGSATPTAWNTGPHVPWASLRSRNRFPS